MRKVLVFSTKSNTTTSVETSATNWGELSTYLASKGLFNPSGMKAIETVTKATLEHKEAILPDGDFKLVLIPTKNESGVTIDADELSEYINERIEELKDAILEYIEENSEITEEDEFKEEAKAIAKELGY